MCDDEFCEVCINCGMPSCEHKNGVCNPDTASEYGRYEIDYDDPRDMDLYDGI